ncbi:diaminopimelate epimerase [Sphingomonas sp. Leaf412]|uniref:diaminopimelate epimerase n=1 Tax=Sphingomonas sp. Leaf412 TaxID=1736370 RepID=UPI0006F1F98D|nr:diaminopimelate epimerase [Sphingomonas sp. Leaf412]KQT31904.1 diaminopimelate epimerase [Sphingomonas sp. Leaf412]
MRIRFVKCHGSGNDFPLVDARDGAIGEGDWPALARALADRAGPVGGDGILALTAGDDTAAFGMRMFNSDGSEAETCLNGLRCVARAGFAALGLDRATVRLKTSHAAVALAPQIAPGVHTIAETAGPATLDLADWPMTIGTDRLIDRPVAAFGPDHRFTAVAIPNPHLIAFVDAIDERELVRIGRLCEAAPDWLPNRANVSFVRVLGPDALFVRTHERGVGLTDSCGSAMAASTYAACLTGRIAFDTDVTVRNRGGRVRARAGGDAMVTLHGNATWEWEGEVDVDLSTARAGDLTVLRRFDAEVAAWAAAVEG